MSILLLIISYHISSAPNYTARLLALQHHSTRRSVRLLMSTDSQSICLLAVSCKPYRPERTFVPDSKQQLRAGLCPIPNLVTTRNSLRPQLHAFWFTRNCSCPSYSAHILSITELTQNARPMEGSFRRSAQLLYRYPVVTNVPATFLTSFAFPVCSTLPCVNVTHFDIHLLFSLNGGQIQL